MSASAPILYAANANGRIGRSIGFVWTGSAWSQYGDTGPQPPPGLTWANYLGYHMAPAVVGSYRYIWNLTAGAGTGACGYMIGPGDSPDTYSPIWTGCPLSMGMASWGQT